jgi:hypothetical protein
MKLTKIFYVLVAIIQMTLCMTSCKETKMDTDGVLMTGTETDPMVKFAIDALPATYGVSVTATQCAEADMTVNLAVDTTLVASYNKKMGTNYYPIPQGAYTLLSDEVTIAKGSAISTVANVSIVDDSKFITGRVYLVPVKITNVSNNMDVIESCRIIYLKVSRTLRFYAPYVGQAAMAYQFLLPSPIAALPVYTWEVKIYATQFRGSGASGTTRVCSFGGNSSSVQGGAIDDSGFKCDQNLLRFGEGTDATNILKVTTKQGSMSSNTAFATNTWYAIALVNDGSTLTLYVNGVKDNSISVSPYTYSLYGVQIGMPSNGYQSSQLFYGRLSEMRLWNRALSAREILANVCGVDPSTTGLLSYWRMNEGSGTVFYDSSPSKRNISYTNGVSINWTYDDTNKCVE